MRYAITTLALLAVGLSPACRNNTTESTYSREVPDTGGPLERDLQVLVKHCHEFIAQNYDGPANVCGILIPETDATDDRISGKGTVDNIFNPEDLPEEGYLYIEHRDNQSPSILINGIFVYNSKSTCANDPYCCNDVAKHIHSVDRRSDNAFYVDRIKHYANAVQKRYNHGVKRK